MAAFFYFMTDLRKIKRALISLSDKTGAVEFARVLARHGVEIISTGGTAKSLRESGITVTEVADVTGFPEMMDGRVKTLHPKIHGAFLALRDNSDHVASMSEHGIEPIDLVVINLYPFEQTIAKDDVTLEEAVENIDIGGPAMIRSASKNWQDVAVVTDPGLYDGIAEEMDANDGALSLNTRQRLAALAYTRTASYDLAISSYLAKQLSHSDLDFLEPFNPLGDLIFIESEDMSDSGSFGVPPLGGLSGENASVNERGEFPETAEIHLEKISDLRYGENPHQKAALYETGEPGGIANAKQLHGKEMSFNNYVDAEAAWNLVQDFDDRAVAIIKHTNPSGVGVGETNEEAYHRALSTDPVSAFGGIVAFNRTVDAKVAASVIEVFSEVIVAPDFDEAALEIFRTKKNLRILKATATGRNASVNERDDQEHDTEVERPIATLPNGRVSALRRLERGTNNIEYKQISGGFLVQEMDLHKIAESDLDLRVVSIKQPSEAELRSMLLAWSVCKHVKSNAIVIANENQTLGVGSGQMNRVDSVRIAAMRAERFSLPIKGAALASDAFFPFRDNVDEAAKMGIGAIIQPGGSIKDDESIAAADEHGIVMVFTGIRHFKH
ncbi:MAG TPA: bifunctional phosphoribosylaminoimidazolecarboxamide formyltransferase/IMP cyclohydrolase [Pyrinomonadaceae bacterium]|nr:bifunctional phosphoribosylaminoimidazolecarboxamide formyltransferase/IMP cyclohydrolase [Pyrinomonadaceae bacterium]